jgi:hypothetical protein
MYICLPTRTITCPAAVEYHQLVDDENDKNTVLMANNNNTCRYNTHIFH